MQFFIEIIFSNPIIIIIFIRTASAIKLGNLIRRINLKMKFLNAVNKPFKYEDKITVRLFSYLFSYLL